MSQKAALELVPRKEAVKFDVLPLFASNNELQVAVPTEASETILAEAIVSIQTSVRIKVTVTQRLPRAEIRRILGEEYKKLDADKPSYNVQAPAVKFASELYELAVRQGASDIHIEPCIDGTGVIRFRVDGALRDVRTVPPDLYENLTNHIKIAAEMGNDDIGPADGTYEFEYSGGKRAGRVASTPTFLGKQRIVIRIMGSSQLAPDFNSLGMRSKMLELFGKVLRVPYGVIIVTGPTGSGKTTTLYSALGIVADRSKSVSTIEDPPELPIPGVVQIPVNEAGGVTFSTGLKSLLRSDPNIIMVGEIRDSDTAKIATQAALTGILVLTTLHVKNASSTIERLAELGVTRSSIESSLTAVLGQRLLRKLCENCRQKVPIPVRLRERSAVWQAEHGSPAQFFAPGGCKICSNTGYIGRTGVFELIVVNNQLREAIINGVSSVRIAKIAMESAGYLPMYEDGVDAVFLGQTSIEELESKVIEEEMPVQLKEHRRFA